MLSIHRPGGNELGSGKELSLVVDLVTILRKLGKQQELRKSHKRHYKEGGNFGVWPKVQNEEWKELNKKFENKLLSATPQRPCEKPEEL